MKYLTLAIFLGVVSTYDVSNMLKIQISKKGQKRIGDEAEDVANVAEAIKNTKPVRNLGASLERWAKSKEVLKIKKLDKKFLASPAGKRLVQEWKDVGECLEENVYHNDTGIHIGNDALNDLTDELQDVGDEYESLSKTKWAKAYDKAYGAAFSNKEFGGVKRRAKAFKESAPGKKLKAEMHDLKIALKEEVKVSDIPEEWKKKANLLKIEVSKEGQAEIEAEAEDVHLVAEKIKNTKVVRNLGSSLERWGESAEVAHLKELDKKFLASERGQRLVAEWKDFGEALKANIYENETGIHIPNSAMDEISDELDDVADEMEDFKTSKWQKAYEKGWEAALKNKQAASVERRFHTFEKSEEAHMLGKELHELDAAIKANLKVSDVPEDWKMQNLLKVEVHNQGDIEDEWNDVEATWDDIKDSKPVRNMGKSLKRWGESKEVDQLKALDKKFKASPMGKKLTKEWTDVFEELDGAVYHNKKGVHIDNDALEEATEEMEDVEAVYKKLEKTHWKKDFDTAFKNVFSNKEAQSVYRRHDAFKKSEEGQALKAELKDFENSLKKNVEVSDVPESWKKDMYLF